MATDFNSFYSNFSSLPSPTLVTGIVPAKNQQTVWNPSPTSSSVALPNSTNLNAQAGYITNNFDVLSQNMARQKAIKQTNLLDFSVLETDKNFSKVNIQNQLNAGIAQLGMATQLLATVLTQFKILGVKEYNPTSIQNSVFNSQALANSNTNFLPVFQQGTTEKTFSSSLTTDINTLYAAGKVLLGDFVSISNIINTAFPTSIAVQNTAIGSILGINLASYIPVSATEIVASPLLADSLSNNGLSPIEQTTFNNNLTTFLNTQVSQPVSTFVTPSNYNNVTITMADPLGINVATQLNDEVKTNFSNSLTPFLNSQNISDPVITSLIVNDFNSNIDSAIYKILPKMTAVVSGVNVSVTNSLGSAMKLAINDAIANVMSDLGIVTPNGTTVAPIDLLQNLHRNIKDRQSIIDQGGSLNDVATLDAELIPFFAAGTFSQSSLNALISNFEVFVNG